MATLEKDQIDMVNPEALVRAESDLILFLGGL